MKAILTKYFGPGNKRGARIKASDEDRNSVFFGCDDTLDMAGNHDAAAIALCRKMGWTQHGLVRGWINGGAVYVFNVQQSRVPVGKVRP